LNSVSFHFPLDGPAIDLAIDYLAQALEQGALPSLRHLGVSGPIGYHDIKTLVRNSVHGRAPVVTVHFHGDYESIGEDEIEHDYCGEDYYHYEHFGLP